MIGRIAGRPSERDDLDQMGILTIGVPNVEDAQELVTALEDRWACCATEQPEQPMTVVFLSPHNASDFAHLVRRVQAWLGEGSLGGITFELRGRGHIHGQPAG
jgi:hypothetical protein